MAMLINNWNISLFRTSIFLIVYGPWNPTKFNSSAVGDAPRKRPTNWLFWVVHSKFIFFWEQHWWRYSHNNQYTRYDYQKYWKAQGRSYSWTNKWIRGPICLYIFKGIGNRKKDHIALEVCQNAFSSTKKYHQDLHFALCGDGINYVYEIKIRGVNKLLICSLYEETECMPSLNETRDIQPRQKDEMNSNFEYLKGKWSDAKVTEYQCFNVNKGKIILNPCIKSFSMLPCYFAENVCCHYEKSFFLICRWIWHCFNMVSHRSWDIPVNVDLLISSIPCG